MDIEEQVEEVLAELERPRIIYVRHFPTHDQVWYVCNNCFQGEHDEVVPHVPTDTEGTLHKSGVPKLACLWDDA